MWSVTNSFCFQMSFVFRPFVSGRQQCYWAVNREPMSIITAQQYPKCWQCLPAVDSQFHSRRRWGGEEFNTGSVLCLPYAVVQLFGFRAAPVAQWGRFSQACNDHWILWYAQNNPNYTSACGFCWEMGNFIPWGPQMCRHYSLAKLSTFFLHERASNIGSQLNRQVALN